MKSNLLIHPIARDTSSLVDQRTFDAFMNCEAPGQPTFEQLMRVGPLPQVCASDVRDVYD